MILKNNTRKIYFHDYVSSICIIARIYQHLFKNKFKLFIKPTIYPQPILPHRQYASEGTPRRHIYL